VTPLQDDAPIERILASTRRIALVGASPHPWRDSHRVMAYLLACGFDVEPVNPNASSVLAQGCVARLEDLTGAVDTVLCFRRSSEMGAVARGAVAIGARYLWMQQGIVNCAAADIAREAGLEVVMDRCIMVEHRRRQAASG
jgi:predicted CoA-binding protein